MGISGLLPLLRSITRRIHIEQLAGQSVAIDAYSWLHKAIYGTCAVDHFHNRPNDSFVDFCMSKVQLLLHYNVRPILVFDGGKLPMKSHREQQRLKNRTESKAKAHELLASGKSSDAYLQIQKAVDVTPEMAASLIRELRRNGIDFVVAPYEADAQMAWLDRTGKVEAIITEDSDLLLFGCKKVLFKLDRDGWADEIAIERLAQTTEIDFVNFSFLKFKHMCMLSGCDYLPSIHGLGLKTAYKYVSKYPDINRVLQVLRAEMSTKMPSNYESEFIKADLTFSHQRIYDIDRRKLCFLNPLPLHMDLEENEWDFLGPFIEDSISQAICEGHYCPETKIPFQQGAIPKFISEEDEFSSQSQTLPFEVILDKKPPRKQNIFSLPIVVMESKNIAASRISIKRTFSTFEKENNNNNNSTSMKGSNNFSFSTESMHRDRIPKTGIESYLSSCKRKARVPLTKAVNISNSNVENLNQRSIKEFFKKDSFK